MPGRTLGGQHHTRRNFFRGLNQEHAGSVLGFPHRSAFVERKLGIDLRRGMLDKPLDSRRPGLFVGLREQNQVAAQLDVTALDLDHHCQFRGEKGFRIQSAAPVEILVADLALEGIHGPLLALGRDDVAMGHQQQRLIFPVSLEPRDQVQALGIIAQQLGRDAAHIAKILARSHAEGQVIIARGVCNQPGGHRRQGEQCGKHSHLFMILARKRESHSCMLFRKGYP